MKNLSLTVIKNYIRMNNLKYIFQNLKVKIKQKYTEENVTKK